MFVLEGLLTLSHTETFLPCGRNYLGSVEAPTLQGCGGRDGHSAGVPTLLNAFSTRIAPYQWLWLSISRKSSQQSSKTCPVHQQQHLAERKLEGAAVSRQSLD